MVTLTTVAAEKVRGFLAGQETAGLRVGVRGGGCSGFQYALALDEPKAEDRIFDIDGIKIIVDEASLQYVDGSEVDYTESLMGSGFQVNNSTSRYVLRVTIDDTNANTKFYGITIQYVIGKGVPGAPK